MTINKDTLADWLTDSCGLGGIEHLEDDAVDFFAWGPIGFVCAGPDEACDVTMVVLDREHASGDVFIDTEYDEIGPFRTHADLKNAIREFLTWAVKTGLAYADILDNPFRKPDAESDTP